MTRLLSAVAPGWPALCGLAFASCTGGSEAAPGSSESSGTESNGTGTANSTQVASANTTGVTSSVTTSGTTSSATTETGSTSSTATTGPGGSTSTTGDGGGGGDGGGETNTATSTAAGATGGSGGALALPWEPSFDTTVLSPDFVSEGAAVADIDGDGALDLVAGPRWYRGPDFELGGELFDAPMFTADQYSTFFLTFADDLNDDGWVDVLAIGDAGGANGSGTPNAFWYENPGPDALETPWAKHALVDGLLANESPAYVNLVGDETKELVYMTDGRLGYATPGASPELPWSFSPISDDVFNTPYVHGLGVGDISGDGLADVVEATGWWEQPTSPGATWVHHEVDFRRGQRGGAQMLVYDVDGDQDGDVVTSLNAHGYGLGWFEQTAAGFDYHEILPASSDTDSFSQIHALAGGDLNGDGLLDIVAGKRYYAHPSTNPDPGTTEPAVLYWFELSRETEVSFTPRLIHAESGVGCNFIVADLDGNARPDVFVANKHGIFLHRQR